MSMDSHKRDFSANARLPGIFALAACIGVVSTLAAFVLLNLIHLFTNLFFFGTLSFAERSPANHTLGLWVIGVPVLGGLIVGLMARYGSEKIRGHGIPEAIEAILFGKSKMSPKVAVLKPLSSGIVIGSGGPFGAEGPIIMTGGALGSLIAQCVKVTSAERKTLLVAGAGLGAVLSHWLPGNQPALWPLVCMAATLGATLGAPLTAIVFAFGLTHDSNALLPLLTATLIAHGFSTVVMRRSIMTEKIARRGYHIYREYGVDPLERHYVDEVMTAPVESIDAGMTVGETLQRFFGANQVRRAYPVVRDGAVIGVADRALLERFGGDDTEAAEAKHAMNLADVFGQTAAAFALPSETCRLVATRLAVHNLERLPVVAERNSMRLVGIVSRSDLVKPSLSHFEEEHKRERFRRLTPSLGKRRFAPVRKTG
ncbi:Voltage-gated ClC-type chloride channel ClcB [Paraburkholderia ultramafica]|uniref:Voltage-gated ClC-type chloride channel ClcB n=1 Tax=Paraburkholderia ultramafica TaxID=1544867 RepID=A0A6S7AVI8_9BURK|nr:chloride channel protein [Paraburkholderia ultramafica]CAB3776906.1 Voltage-gated ClC-type chloride channel ClcB [Paraburkholderia ultramafica]